MVISKKELIENLKACMPGIETGSVTLQGADTFVFHNGKIFTYNDVISVTSPIRNNSLISEGIEGCVKGDEFFKVISKLPNDEIKFTVDKDGNWVLKSGKAKVQMNLVQFDFKSRIENIKPDENSWTEIDGNFHYALGVCQMANNKTQLSGVYINDRTMMSSDGNQLNMYELTLKLPTCWLSENSVKELLKLNKITGMQVVDSWAHFRNEDGTIFSVKTLQADSYPFESLKKIMDATDISKSQLQAKFPKLLFDSIDRAISFGIEIDSHCAVKLAISKENIIVSSQRTSGSFQEKVLWDEKIEKDFEPIDVYVDGEMMQYIGQRTVEFHLVKGPIRNGKPLPRMMFFTENSKHLIATLDGEKE